MTSVKAPATTNIVLPKTMKALRQHAYGEASKVLTMDDLELPTATGESILVKVHAATINPIDYKLLHGDLAMIKKLKFPHTPGHDFAGTVVSIGTSCKRLRVGDRVYGTSSDANGAFAEYLLIEEKLAACVPAKLSFEEAACISMVGQTAIAAFHKIGSLANKRVLILGGSGGTGSLGIQIAKAFGAAYVATTCSSANTDYVRNLGADHVIDYSAVNFADALSVEQPFDVIYDCIGGREQWDNAQRIINKSGTFLTLIGDANHDPINVSSAVSTIGKVLSRKVASVFTSHGYIFHVTSPSYETLDQLSEIVNNGKIKTNSLITKRFSFTLPECTSMYQQSESGHTRGKVVMLMGNETESMNVKA